MFCATRRERVGGHPLKVRSKTKNLPHGFCSPTCASSVNLPRDLSVLFAPRSSALFCSVTHLVQDRAALRARSLSAVPTRKNFSAAACPLVRFNSMARRSLLAPSNPVWLALRAKQAILGPHGSLLARRPLPNQRCRLSANPYAGWRPPRLIIQTSFVRRTPRRRATHNTRPWPTCRPAL